MSRNFHDIKPLKGFVLNLITSFISVIYLYELVNIELRINPNGFMFDQRNNDQ